MKARVIEACWDYIFGILLVLTALAMGGCVVLEKKETTTDAQGKTVTTVTKEVKGIVVEPVYVPPVYIPQVCGYVWRGAGYVYYCPPPVYRPLPRVHIPRWEWYERDYRPLPPPPPRHHR